MKLIAKVKLQADEVPTRALMETIRLANSCCNWLSAKAWEHKKFRAFDLHKLCYHEARATFPLTAQVVVRCISKVADAYKLDKKTQRRFRPTGAIAYDLRILRWYLDKQQVSIWTTKGRLKLTYSAGPRQLELLKTQQGQSDLIHHKGRFYLGAVCNAIEESEELVNEFLGLDLGVTKIASDSDGDDYSGSEVKSVRCRHRRLRKKLQSKGTRSAKRLLKRLSGKERAFSMNTNHVISKQIVAKAKRTCRGISIENLNGIRGRIRARRSQRAVLHSWAFDQLREFLTYKAKLAGVPLVAVDPRNSSRECSRCGHIDKLNRPSQSEFQCLACGFTANADYNAACVIAGRATVNWPNATKNLSVASR